jgi:CHAT domain-containing protein
MSARNAYAPIRKKDVAALVAAVPHSHMRGWSNLPSTRREATGVKRILPEGTLIPLPYPADASDDDRHGITASLLLEKLPDASILHLACHGFQNPKDALNSGFVMSDEMLTIERLMQTPLPQAFMAFLSACETAKGDKVNFAIP